MEKDPKVKVVETSKQVLTRISAIKNSENPTLVDLFLNSRPGLVQKQALRDSLRVLGQGCMKKCLPSDIKGGVT